jgi:hypothetical protein
MLEPAPVYLFGATRSGTTWLQNMLGSHPAIATPQELDLMSRYVAPWRQTWESQLPASAADWHRHRYKGLPSILTEEVFDGVITDAVARIYEEVLAAKPGATTVLEKVPGYGEHAALILRHVPNARFVHLIRDGRDVVASLQRAATGWGRGWAPSSAQRGAWVWRTNVENGRAAGRLTPSYLELRYEALTSAEGPALLQQAFSFCGIELSSAEARQTFERFALTAGGPPPPSSIVWGGEVRQRIGSSSAAEPEGFFGEGRHGSWQTGLGAFDRWSFDHEAGTLLRELDYETDSQWTSAGIWRVLGPGRLAFATALRRLRFAVGAARRILFDRPGGSRTASQGTSGGATA